MRSDKHVPYLFLAPALLGLVLFRLYPIFLALWESLFVTGFGPAGGRSFVGLENFQFLFEDFVFWRSVKATAILTIIINPVQIALALGLALLLQRKSRNIRLIRSLFLLPIGVALPIATVIWGLMLNPNQGLINGMLDVIGVSPQPFLTSEAQAIWAIVLIATWKGVAFWMLFLLAGLEDIPKSLYEAIRVDGANWFGRLRYVTMPLLRRTLLFVLVADTAANFVLIVSDDHPDPGRSSPNYERPDVRGLPKRLHLPRLRPFNGNRDFAHCHHPGRDCPAGLGARRPPGAR